MNKSLEPEELTAFLKKILAYGQNDYYGVEYNIAKRGEVSRALFLTERFIDGNCKIGWLDDNNQFQELDLTKYKYILIEDYGEKSGDLITLYTEEEMSKDEQYIWPDSMSIWKALPIHTVLETELA